MSIDKEQATRLADALEMATYALYPEHPAYEAIALLRRWPDSEPVAHQYLFDGYNGPVWRNDSAPWNGMLPKASRPLYTAPQPERIAELEVENAQLRAAARDRHNKVVMPQRDRIAALEDALRFVLTMTEGSTTGSDFVMHERVRDALRKE